MGVFCCYCVLRRAFIFVRLLGTNRDYPLVTLTFKYLKVSTLSRMCKIFAEIDIQVSPFCVLRKGTPGPRSSLSPGDTDVLFHRTNVSVSRTETEPPFPNTRNNRTNRSKR